MRAVILVADGIGWAFLVGFNIWAAFDRRKARREIHELRARIRGGK